MVAQRTHRKRAPQGRVLIDLQGRYGTSPATQFKTLLRGIQRSLKAGDMAVALSGAKLNVAMLALQRAIWVEEEVLPRDLYAFSALNIARLTPNERLRTVASRMLGRPDRNQEDRSATYPAGRILAEYRALTGQGGGDTSYYFSRRVCGLSREREDFEPIRLPLSRGDAVTAIQHIHGFSRRRGALQFIQEAIRVLPASQRPKLPAIHRRGGATK